MICISLYFTAPQGITIREETLPVRDRSDRWRVGEQPAQVGGTGDTAHNVLRGPSPVNHRCRATHYRRPPPPLSGYSPGSSTPSMWSCHTGAAEVVCSTLVPARHSLSM